MAGSEAPALRKPPATATPNPPTVTAPVADSTLFRNRPHIGGSAHQHPQLVGQETRANGAVDLKTEP